MTCGCNIDVKHSARPRRWDGWFTIGPFEDLGERLDVAAKAIGWRPPSPIVPGRGFVWVRGSEFIRAQPNDTLAVVRRLADAAAVESMTSIGIGELRGFVEDRALYRKIEIVEPVPIDQLLANGVEAVDDLMADIFKALPIIDPGKPRNRAVIIRQTADAMVAKIRPWERRASTAGKKFLDANWPDISKAEQKRIIAAASRRIKAVPIRGIRGINETIRVQGRRTMQGARRAAIKRHDLNINANLTSPDRASLRASQRTSVKWLTNEYGSRAVGFEKAASRTVEQGLLEGLGRDEIAEDLARQFDSSLAGRTESYFRVFAGALVDRSRTRAELFSYREAQITEYIASAVLDEATTDFCRWVDGKVFNVETGISIMDRVEETGLSVDSMKDANPWARQSRRDGETVWSADGQSIFRVDQSGVGTQSPGSYTDKPGANNLDALGVGPPPYHGNCRTTTIANIK